MFCSFFYRLGDYYYYGLGTDIDFEAAAFHYRIASEQQNNAQAMFNLGYMHELGHGMPQDIHLAKRFYDMAAETSTDAKVPVALALTKLAFTFALNNWQNYKLANALTPATWTKIELYWDLYLLSLLVGVLGVVVFFRRTAGGQQQQQQPRPANRGQQGQQPAVAAAPQPAAAAPAAAPAVAPATAAANNPQPAADTRTSDNRGDAQSSPETRPNSNNNPPPEQPRPN